MHFPTQATRLGHAAAARGWRRTAADKITGAVTKRTRTRTVRADQIRAIVGLALLALSVRFIVGTLRRYRSAGE